jgi:hypothetical protein
VGPGRVMWWGNQGELRGGGLLGNEGTVVEDDDTAVEQVADLHATARKGAVVPFSWSRVSERQTGDFEVACFSRVIKSVQTCCATTGCIERKRDRDSNTGSNPVGATTVR